jgi:hypothetical protein
MNTVLPATALALIEAVAVVSGAAVLDGTEGRLVCGREVGLTRKILWSRGTHDIGNGRHEESPRITALMRS